MPISGVTCAIFSTVFSSTSVEGSFFSVARTTPLAARMPRDVAPLCTAASACLICTSSPLELKVVSE